MERHGGVFISHIAEEAAVALVLQETLRVVFGDDLSVFVRLTRRVLPPDYRGMKQSPRPCCEQRP